MRKSFVVRLLIATVMLLMLALSPALAQDDVIELRFMNWWDASREPLMLELIARFEAENPGITVVNEVQPWGQPQPARGNRDGEQQPAQHHHDQPRRDLPVRRGRVDRPD